MNKRELRIAEVATGMNKVPVAVFFSGGKDSIAATHLWLKFHRNKDNRFVYLYFVEGLKVIERCLRYYEKRWGIRIDRRPCHEHLSMVTSKVVKYADTEKSFMKETGLEWIVTGMKRNDSLSRRGMFKNVEGVTDDRNRIHPVLDWTDKQVHCYCHLYNLPLPASYSYEGLSRSVWVPTPEMLLWLQGHFPGDYQKIIDTFPDLELAAIKRFRGYI